MEETKTVCTINLIYNTMKRATDRSLACWFQECYELGRQKGEIEKDPLGSNFISIDNAENVIDSETYHRLCLGGYINEFDTIVVIDNDGEDIYSLPYPANCDFVPMEYYLTETSRWIANHLDEECCKTFLGELTIYNINN